MPAGGGRLPVAGVVIAIDRIRKKCFGCDFVVRDPGFGLGFFSVLYIEMKLPNISQIPSPKYVFCYQQKTISYSQRLDCPRPLSRFSISVVFILLFKTNHLTLPGIFST
jgi:hypothetical protein